MRNTGKPQTAVGNERAGGSLAGARQRPAQPPTRRPDGPARQRAPLPAPASAGAALPSGHRNKV